MKLSVKSRHKEGELHWLPLQAFLASVMTYPLQPRSAPFFYVWSENKEKYVPCPKSFLCALNKATGNVCWQGEDWVLLHRYFEGICQANSQAQHTDMSAVLHVSAPGV